MPEPDGFEVCRQIKRDPATRLIPVVLITGLHDLEDRIKGIDAGADDFLAKPFNFDELTARVRALMRLKRFTDDLDSAESVITSLALTIEARDRYTEGHCERLAQYSTALGAELGLNPDDLSALQWGGFLHDVGKIGVSDTVLQKPASLTMTEFQAMKLHTIIGERLCGELNSLRRVRPIVRHHHEHLDGSGYPDGLRGDAIPILAQIMGIVGRVRRADDRAALSTRDETRDRVRAAPAGSRQGLAPARPRRSVHRSLPALRFQSDVPWAVPLIRRAGARPSLRARAFAARFSDSLRGPTPAPV